MRFRRNIKVVPLEERERKKFPWGKYIYFAILLIAAFLFGKWIIMNSIFIHGRGILQAEFMSIEAKVTGRISKTTKDVGDKVNKGETVVYLDTSGLNYELTNLEEYILFSPVTGIIAELHKKRGEQVRPGETVFTVFDPLQLCIRGYFDEANEGRIKLGDNVWILFGMGKRYKGTINKIYPITGALPKEFLKNYDSKKPVLVVEIISQEGEPWPNILGLRSRLMIKRFFKDIKH